MEVEEAGEAAAARQSTARQGVLVIGSRARTATQLAQRPPAHTHTHAPCRTPPYLLLLLLLLLQLLFAAPSS